MIKGTFHSMGVYVFIFSEPVPQGVFCSVVPLEGPPRLRPDSARGRARSSIRPHATVLVGGAESGFSRLEVDASSTDSFPDATCLGLPGWTAAPKHPKQSTPGRFEGSPISPKQVVSGLETSITPRSRSVGGFSLGLLQVPRCPASGTLFL